MERNTFSQMLILIPTVTMTEKGGVDGATREKKIRFCNSALFVAVRSLCSCNETAGCGTALLEVI